MKSHKFNTKEFCIQGTAKISFEEYINAKNKEDALETLKVNLSYEFDNIEIISVDVEESWPT